MEYRNRYHTPGIASIVLLVLIWAAWIGGCSIALAEDAYFATREEAILHVSSHVEPKDCFVWKDGPDPAKPWRVIPGTGCAHWVAHELGLGIFPSPWQRWEMGEIEPPLPLEAWRVCYDGFYIKVPDVIAGRGEVEIKDAEVGDIWTDNELSHTGIVRQVGDTTVLVEHDSSSQGGVVQTWLSSDSGKCWRRPPISSGLQWLRTSQEENGSWSDSTGITALVLLSFFNAGFLPATDTVDTDGDGTPDLQEGMAYLAAHFDTTEGYFYGDDIYICYDTALCMLAFIAADRGGGTTHYQNIITQAKDYLLSVQYDDNTTDPDYGGWGYPRADWADLSNTQWVVMALDAAYDYLGLTKPSPATSGTWTNKLLEFLDHCQRTDGGFEYKEGYWDRSVGSMSMAGLWSLLLAGLYQPEARITQVQNWISDNYTLDENPGRGSTALYYYYVSFAKALTMAGWSTITDSGGTRHDWYAELKNKLEALQHQDGYWVNSDTGAWEGNKDLCAAYALLALETQQLPTGQQLSWVLTLHSPGDLHIYDPAGRHVGANEEFGWIDEDIPGSSYEISATGEQIITLTLLQAGTYRIEIVGTGNGSYTLESKAYQDALLVSSKSFSGNLTPGQVRATNATLTSMEGALTVFMEEPQAVPSGLVATPGNAVVDLSWSAFQESGFDFAGYNVYRSTASHAGYSKVNDSSIASTSYHDSGLINDTTYYYVVTAISSTAEETPYSREVSSTPMANQPPQVNVLAPVAGEVITGASYQVQWEASDPDDATDTLSIDIESSNNAGTSWTMVSSGEENDGLYEWGISALSSGGSYVIRITATDPQGASTSATSGVFTVSAFSGSVIVAPNPVTGAGAVFFYALQEGASAAKLMVFNVTGRLLFETPVDVETSRFPTSGTWNPVNQDDTALANGPYIYVLVADGKVIGKGKMVIQR